MPEAQTLPPERPILAEQPSQFILLERSVEDEYRPRMLQELQRRVDEVAQSTRSIPVCARCHRIMVCQDVRPVSWWARFGRLRVRVPRYRCPDCDFECRPLLDLLGVEPGRISGSLARLLALLAAVAPYPLAARLVWLLLGVTVSPMGVWRVAQRLGQAAAGARAAASATGLLSLCQVREWVLPSRPRSSPGAVFPHTRSSAHDWQRGSAGEFRGE